MNITKKKIDDLHPASYNPRIQLKPGDKEFEKLKNSILEFGYVEPIIWNKQTGNVVGGHQRLEVMKHLGETEVDCVVIDIDEKKEKALNIALNKISGEWDTGKLTDLLKELDGDGLSALTGFDMKELDDLFSGSVYDVKEDDFDTEQEVEQIATPFTKQGDIWHIKNHKVLCGDSTKLDDVIKLFGDKHADLIVTDPPYNIDYGNAEQDRAKATGKEIKDSRNILNDNMDDENFYTFLLDFYKATYQVAKGGGVIYVFHSTKESVNFISAMKNAGFKVSQTLVWVKDRFTLGRSDYQWQFEPILYGWKTEDGKPHYFIHDRTLSSVADDRKDFTGLKKDELIKLLQDIIANTETNVINDNKPLKNAEHPTMKPVTLCGKLINNSSRERNIVYDAFAGSGSTMMAAEQMNRISYNIELDEKYCDVIVKRFVKTFGDKEIYLERDGKTIDFSATPLSK